MQLPSYVQIEPVGQCNLRCQMCSIQFRQDGPPYGPPAFMQYDTFTGLIDQLASAGTRELHMQGLGEPMMHPRFFDMVEYATGKGMRVTTNSNLTLLNERRAERCIKSGLACLHVSIDGASAETYEHIRVRAHFERVLGNLERLITMRERLGSTQPSLVMVVVIMRQNLHELPNLVRLASQHAIERVFVQHLCHDFAESSLPGYYQPMRTFVQAQTLLEEDPQRVQYYFHEARQVAQEMGIELRLPRTQLRIYPPGTPGSARCNWPWKGAYISYSGYAMPCCMVSTPDRINFGNVFTDGIEATWNNSSYTAFRDKLASDEPPEVCRSCSVYSGTF